MTKIHPAAVESLRELDLEPDDIEALAQDAADDEEAYDAFAAGQGANFDAPFEGER